MKGLRWKVVDGKRARFWEDNWLDGVPLKEACPQEIHETERNLVVRDLLVDKSGWNWPMVSDRLSNVNLLKLASVSLSSSEEDSDQMGWLYMNGAFTVCSAYRLYMALHTASPPWRRWRMIWKLQVQQRVKAFLWILAHDRLLTNYGQWRRKMTDSPGCFRCNGDIEDSLHTLRDCPSSKEI